jgi:hypothetical protein
MRRRRHHRLHRLHDDDAAAAVPEGPAGTGSVAPRRPGDVLVAVAPPLAELLADLAAVLGPGFTVEAGLPADGGLAVLRAATPTTVAFWRARYPTAGLFVLDPFGECGPAECLDAGADAYQSGPVPTAEVAAVLRSLARRMLDVRLPA